MPRPDLVIDSWPLHHMARGVTIVIIPISSIGFSRETLQDLEASCDHAAFNAPCVSLHPGTELCHQGLTLPPEGVTGEPFVCSRNQNRGFEGVLPRRVPTSTSGSVVDCQAPFLGTHVLFSSPEGQPKSTASSQDLSRSGSWYTSHQCTTSQFACPLYWRFISTEIPG